MTQERHQEGETLKGKQEYVQGSGNKSFTTMCECDGGSVLYRADIVGWLTQKMFLSSLFFAPSSIESCFAADDDLVCGPRYWQNQEAQEPPVGGGGCCRWAHVAGWSSPVYSNEGLGHCKMIAASLRPNPGERFSAKTQEMFVGPRDMKASDRVCDRKISSSPTPDYSLMLPMNLQCLSICSTWTPFLTRSEGVNRPCDAAEHNSSKSGGDDTGNAAAYARAPGTSVAPTTHCVLGSPSEAQLKHWSLFPIN
ncbi:hypothetical protein H920_20149 [Fukomys damarensis]|uniref:Uncharacterized protein n=1 Tax=Fukomys damarensis TaxID=885580 RepID=A0A091CIZ7_FUKDA|nr:hypothetical protein H920_20149 [Fukomys damarensis]